jgi:hypothetical protein
VLRLEVEFSVEVLTSRNLAVIMYDMKNYNVMTGLSAVAAIGGIAVGILAMNNAAEADSYAQGEGVAYLDGQGQGFVQTDTVGTVINGQEYNSYIPVDVAISSRNDLAKEQTIRAVSVEIGALIGFYRSSRQRRRAQDLEVAREEGGEIIGPNTSLSD